VEPYVLEVVVDEEGAVRLPALPFAPGTKLLVTVEEAEPMDADAFDTALRAHYRQ